MGSWCGFSLPRGGDGAADGREVGQWGDAFRIPKEAGSSAVWSVGEALDFIRFRKSIKAVLGSPPFLQSHMRVILTLEQVWPALMEQACISSSHPQIT